MKKALFSLLVILCGYAQAQLIPTYDDVWVQMRDGEQLQADVYIPTGVDSAEVILIQTPYNKDNFSLSLPLGIGLNLDSQPYIWVIVDWRGFYGSNGADISNFERGEDGYDICDWIVNQSWHLDRIGTWGPSALGGVQYSTAQQQHPNHTCAVPLVATPYQAFTSYFMGGVLEKARLEQLDALGYGLSPIVLANPYYSAIWQIAESSSWYPEDIAIPTLQIGGWYDHNIDHMMDWYTATRTSSVPAVQDEQWLLVGPWVHGGTGAAYVGSSIQGELQYPNAEYKSDSMALDFFDYYLLDSANNWQNTALITYYETGLDTWNSTNAENIEILNNESLYLANNGLLKGTQSFGFSTFISDPDNPSPTIGGATLHTTLDQGPYDQVSLDSRSDITGFSSFELVNNVQISGRVSFDLHVEADQPDCDISVRLIDVYPDGRNMLVSDGIHRMRFRNGYTQQDETFMSPGIVYPVSFELPFINYTWLAGHQIKVMFGGNSSYRWDVNLQNGGPMYTSGVSNIANINIHHSSAYPSKVNFPGNNPSLGVQKEEGLVSTLIYPNPVEGFLQIKSSLPVEYFEVTSLKGEILISGKGNTIDCEGLNSGVYLIKVHSSNRVSVLKFIKP
jgi:predicted acyl esterase